VDQELAVSLVISAVGITLLFLALLLFYGLLVLLTSVFKERPSTKAEGTAKGQPGAAETDAMLQAAVIGVAVARAEADQASSLGGVHAEEATTDARTVGPWWMLHHQRQVALRPGSRRVP
jgi:hypothetical protein